MPPEDSQALDAENVEAGVVPEEVAPETETAPTGDDNGVPEAENTEM